MTKLEKAIKGLESCNNMQCSSCPYYDNGESFPAFPGCVPKLRVDALELLKEQEPHVLTLDEALGGDESWFEFRPVYIGRYADCYKHDDLKKAAIYFTGNTFAHLYKLADYGKTWRCWNIRPTDEQRKAAKWEWV